MIWVRRNLKEYEEVNAVSLNVCRNVICNVAGSGGGACRVVRVIIVFF